MDIIETTDVRDAIMGWMDENDRGFAWLEKKTGINYHTLYSIIKLKHVKIDDAKLEIINKELGTDFKN